MSNDYARLQTLVGIKRKGSDVLMGNNCIKDKRTLPEIRLLHDSSSKCKSNPFKQ